MQEMSVFSLVARSSATDPGSLTVLRNAQNPWNRDNVFAWIWATGPRCFGRSRKSLPFHGAFVGPALKYGYPQDVEMDNPDEQPEGVRVSTALTFLRAVRHRIDLTI